MLKEKAHGKINLHLQVEGKRDDGYHTLLTLFALISLHDTVFIEAHRDPSVELCIRGDYPLPQGSKNIAYKAARWYLARYGIKNWGVKITIEKRIPPGSGLGGGSSDAGAVIRALVRFFGESDPDLVRDSVEIGADVPFFVSGAHLALASGVGEQIEPLSARIAPPGLLVAVPPFSLSTKEVYEAFDALQKEAHSLHPPLEKSAIADAASSGDASSFRELFYNHLELPVFKKHPELEAAKKRFYEAGAIFAQMTGSGSALFALCSGSFEPALSGFTLYPCELISP